MDAPASVLLVAFLPTGGIGKISGVTVGVLSSHRTDLCTDHLYRHQPSSLSSGVILTAVTLGLLEVRPEESSCAARRK